MVNSTQLFFTDCKKLFKNYVVIFCFLLLSIVSIGQTNPTAQSLPYTQNFSTLTGSTTTYPDGWQGWDVAGSLSASYVTSAPSGNRALSASGNNNTSSRGLYDMTGKLGVVSTGSALSTPCLSINTLLNTSISVTYKAGTQYNIGRVNEIGLQYRIGTSGAFTNVVGSTYQNTASPTNTGTSTTAINIQTISFELPSACENQSVVQLRWMIRDVSGTGNRTNFSIDDISITGTTPVLETPIVTGATVNGTVGTALTNYQIVATNSPTSYAVSSGTLPAGLTLNTTFGVISGTPTTAGSSSVQVTATNGTGTSDPATLDFVIALGNQTITFNALANRQYGDANFNLTATASSGLTVDYNSSNPLVATVSGNTVTIVGEGTTDITASQAGNANYNAAANVVRTLTITKRQLTVGGLTGENKVYDATTTASATGTATLTNVLAGDESNVSLSGTPSFAFVTATVGTNKTINGSGFTLSGSAAGNYVLTQPTLTANVTVKAITVTGASANNKVYDGTTTATIVGGTLNGVEATDVANVTLVSTGSFDTATVGENKPVTLSISGSAAFNYSLTQPGITANITKADQTINFTALPVLNTNSGNVPLVATATSGLVVEFESSNPSVVTVSGNTLTVVGAGTAVITASQAGNTNYNPAVDVTQNVTVNLAPAIIAGWDFQTTTNGGTAVAAAPGTPKQITANFGSGVLYLDGTNFSSNFIAASTGNELTAFAGTALNTTGTSFSTNTSGAASLALASGTNSTANGKSAVFVINMSNYSNLEISYAVQRSGSGFTINEWEYSLDGLVWNSIGTINSIPTSFGVVSLPVTSNLNNVSTAYIRLTVDGSTASGSNNRLDNIKFEATIIPITEVTWNGTEWSNIAGPDETIDAILVGPYNTTANAGFTAKSLTVTTGGSLTIGAGTSVTVVNELNNELTAAAVVINSDGSLIQEGTTNTNSGNVTVLRNSQDLMRLDYTMWSSPVAAQNLGGFSPNTMTNRFYTYNTATDVYATIANTNNFAVGQGYLIRTPDNHPTSATSWLGQFVGLPNSGDLTVGLSTAGQGFNLVGNPYPSPISISTLLSENTGVIGGNLYFWRKTNGATGSAYITYSGGTFSDGPHDFNNIQPGQGFIVAAVSGADLTFTNTQRQADNGDFYRNANATQSEGNSRIWLNVSTNNAVVGQMAIGYNASASNDIDASDAVYINDNAVALNSFVANTELAVQHRASFEATDVVPLRFKTNAAGSYTIAINDVDGLFTNEAQTIFLKDNLLNIEHDLRNSAYQFTSASGVFADRFEVVYQSTLGVTLPEFANQTIVFAKDNNLNVQSGSSIIKGIQVFDVQGRLVLDVKDINSTSYSASLEQISNGVLLVKVFTDNGMSTTKKIIK